MLELLRIRKLPVMCSFHTRKSSLNIPPVPKPLDRIRALRKKPINLTTPVGNVNLIYRDRRISHAALTHRCEKARTELGGRGLAAGAKSQKLPIISNYVGRHDNIPVSRESQVLKQPQASK